MRGFSFARYNYGESGRWSRRQTELPLKLRFTGLALFNINAPETEKEGEERQKVFAEAY